MNYKISLNHIFFFIIIFYLIFQTGIHSDDYTIIDIFQKNYFANYFNFNSKGQNIYAPLNYYLIYWIYAVAGNEILFIYDFFKIFLHFICYFLIYLFLSDYFKKKEASIFSFIYLFYPIHDANNYWLMTCGFTLTISLAMFAVYLLKKNFYILGFLISLSGAFFFYSSPPFIIGLSTIFLVKKDYTKFLCIFIPGCIYIFYYLFIKLYFYDLEFDNKIVISNNSVLLFYNFLLQIITTLEVQFGPSNYLKIINSFNYFDFFGLCAIIATLFIFKNSFQNIKFSKELIICFLSIIILSIFMLSLTGRYFHSSFNLGNRVNIYSSLFFFIIIYLIRNFKFVIWIYLSIILLSIFNLSNHWKNWNLKQIDIISNINNSIELENINNDSVYFINNGYSKLGQFSHIEFIVSPWVLETLTNKYNFQPVYLNSDTIINSNKIYNKKQNKYYSILDINYIYDTEINSLKKYNQNELMQLIKKNKLETRHWIQTIDLKYLNFITKNFKNLNYLFYEK